MIKGLLILFTVFAVIALLNFSSLKLIKIEVVKKAKFKKVFFYFYGLFLVCSGLVQSFEKSELNFVFIIQIVLGVTFITLNYLNKINPTKNSI